MTGVYRDRTCTNGPQEVGLHANRAVMTEEPLAHRTSVGHDSLPAPSGTSTARTSPPTPPTVTSTDRSSGGFVAAQR
ncbi:DUF2237 family protein [Nocardioides glacieisoli]|uniref:DUF2237 family protein n=1 Tax=Nocardioides glacieisoli TaxID=1168730 RepID=A0A4Q2RUJ0_9ACTN|nr:DUF2237 family protein [Nocardioides glacieisoli]